MYKANEKFHCFSFFTLDTSLSFHLPPPHLLVSSIAYPKKYLYNDVSYNHDLVVHDLVVKPGGQTAITTSAVKHGKTGK